MRRKFWLVLLVIVLLVGVAAGGLYLAKVGPFTSQPLTRDEPYTYFIEGTPMPISSMLLLSSEEGLFFLPISGDEGQAHRISNRNGDTLLSFPDCVTAAEETRQQQPDQDIAGFIWRDNYPGSAFDEAPSDRTGMCYTLTSEGLAVAERARRQRLEQGLVFGEDDTMAWYGPLAEPEG